MVAPRPIVGLRRVLALPRDPLVALMRALNTTYAAFAEERDDPTFPLRVRLGQ